MKYKKGDRILYNRQKFGTVYQDQTTDGVVNAVFDHSHNEIRGVRSDLVELVSDPQHEAILATLINSADDSVTTDVPLHKMVKSEVAAKNLKSGLAGDLINLADELSTGADVEMNIVRLRITMTEVSNRLRNIAKGL